MIYFQVGDICQTEWGALVLIIQRYDNGTSDFYKVRFLGHGDHWSNFANFRTRDLTRLVAVEDTCQP